MVTKQDTAPKQNTVEQGPAVQHISEDIYHSVENERAVN